MRLPTTDHLLTLPLAAPPADWGWTLWLQVAAGLIVAIVMLFIQPQWTLPARPPKEPKAPRSPIVHQEGDGNNTNVRGAQAVVGDGMSGSITQSVDNRQTDNSTHVVNTSMVNDSTSPDDAPLAWAVVALVAGAVVGVAFSLFWGWIAAGLIGFAVAVIVLGIIASTRMSKNGIPGGLQVGMTWATAVLAIAGGAASWMLTLTLPVDGMSFIQRAAAIDRASRGTDGAISFDAAMGAGRDAVFGSTPNSFQHILCVIAIVTFTALALILAWSRMLSLNAAVQKFAREGNVTGVTARRAAAFSTRRVVCAFFTVLALTVVTVGAPIAVGALL